MQENNSPQSIGGVQKQAPTEDKNKLPRHPRWTIQDTFILIQGKQVVENRGSKGQGMGSVFGSDPFEPKWDFVSSYCKEHGVDRGAVQCRKKWSNLVCDFRKVKAWESEVRGEGESFWMMRNDLRREKKLPGFFDKEIYELLNGGALAATAYPLRTVSDDSTDVDEEEECENVLKNKTLMLEENVNGENSTSKTSPTRVPEADTTKEKYPSMGNCGEPISQEGRKRKQTSSNGYEDTSLKKLLIEALEKNFLMINAQLEAQNINNQLEREQKKHQDNNLVDALTKIADAIGKIADKL